MSFVSNAKTKTVSVVFEMRVNNMIAIILSAPFYRVFVLSNVIHTRNIIIVLFLINIYFTINIWFTLFRDIYENLSIVRENLLNPTCHLLLNKT